MLGIIFISRLLLYMFTPHLSIPRQLASTFRLALLSIFKRLFHSGKSSTFALTTGTFFGFHLLTHLASISHQSISYYLIHFYLHLPCFYHLLVTATDNCLYFIRLPTFKQSQKFNFTSMLIFPYPLALQQPILTHANFHQFIPSLRLTIVHLFLFQPIYSQFLAFISDSSPHHLFPLIFHFDTTTSL
jgi:hypothetical protein